MVNQSKHEKFKRLAILRGNRLLKDIKLIGNLANTNNYEYTDLEIAKMFAMIEEELKVAKTRFRSNKKREIKL
jgi:hypothetical protein